MRVCVFVHKERLCVCVCVLRDSVCVCESVHVCVCEVPTLTLLCCLQRPQLITCFLVELAVLSEQHAKLHYLV